MTVYFDTNYVDLQVTVPKITANVEKRNLIFSEPEPESDVNF